MKNRLQSILRRIPFKILLMICFVLVYFTPTLAVGFPALHVVTENMKATAQHDLINMMTNTAENYSQCLAKTRSHQYQMMRDPLIHGLAYMRKPDSLYTRYSASELKTMVSRLGAMVTTSNAFTNVAFCFPNLNFALTNKGDGELKAVVERTYNFNGITLEEWNAIISSLETDEYFIPNVHFSNAVFVSNGAMLVLLERQPYTKEIIVVSMYYIDESLFESFTQPLEGYQDLAIRLVDEAGETLYTNHVTADDGLHFAVSVPKSQWILECQIPASVLFNNVHFFQYICLSIFMTIALVGCILVWLLSTFCYRPIRNLFFAVNTEKDLADEPTLLDFNQLALYMEELDTKENILHKNMQDYQELLGYAALSKLLKGKLNLTRGQMMSIFQSLNMPLTRPYFTVGVVFDPQPEGIAALLKSSDEVSAYMIDLDNQPTILFSHQEMDLESKVAQCCPTPIIALSSTYDDYGKAEQAYLEARKACKDRIIRSESKKEAAAATPTSALAQQALHYINAHLCEQELSLGLIANEFSVTQATLSRALKSHTGEGYLDIVNRRRIALAKEFLLQEENITIKELAQKVGFSNDVTFRRLFKKYEGLLPSEY